MPRTVVVLVTVAALALGLGLALPAGAAAPEAPASAERILRYRESGEWNRDITRALNRARRALDRGLDRGRRPRRPTVVFDIDDTALSLYACFRRYDFDYDRANTPCIVGGRLPAIRQTLALYRRALRRGVRVVFITGRPEGIRDVTEQNLRRAGYRGRHTLVLQANDYRRESRVPYKSGARRALVRDGATLLVNVGDQRSDLAGGPPRPAALRVLVPNPMYRTP